MKNRFNTITVLVVALLCLTSCNDRGGSARIAPKQTKVPRRPAVVKFCGRIASVASRALACHRTIAATDLAALAKLRDLRRLDLRIFAESQLLITAMQDKRGSRRRGDLALPPLPRLESLTVDGHFTQLLRDAEHRLPRLRSVTFVDIRGALPDLHGFPNLRTVIVRGGRLASLEGLRGSPVSRLELVGTAVGSIAALTAVRGLRSLRIRASKIADLTPIASLDTLRTLRIEEQEAKSWMSLARLRQLEHLALSGFGPPRDVLQRLVAEVIASSPSLRTLDLSRSHLANASPLAKLHQLQTLKLAWTKLVGLRALSSLTRLEELDLSGQQSIVKSVDLGWIASLRRLRVFNLRLALDVDSVGFLARCSALERLSIGRTAVTDLRPLANLHSLRALSLSGHADSHLKSLAGLERLRALRKLDLTATDLRLVKALPQLVRLESLVIDRARHIDASALTRLAHLKTLSARGTNLADLRTLAGIKSLVRLELTDTKVSDLTPLHAMTALTHLELSKTRVTSVKPIGELRNLVYLGLRGTQVNDLRPIRHLRRLRYLDLSNLAKFPSVPAEGLGDLRVVFVRHSKISSNDLTRLTANRPSIVVDRRTLFPWSTTMER